MILSLTKAGIIGVEGKRKDKARISQGIDCNGQEIPLRKKTTGEIKTMNINAFTLFLKRKLMAKPAKDMDKI